jgi:hypothetical protein
MRLITLLPLPLALAAMAAIKPPSAMGTANDPFVGKWRLDVSRSTIVDDMRVQAVGANKYAFNFEGGPTETVVADGTDQPAMPGTTLSVKSGAPRKLTVVRKQDGRTMLSADWTLSPDGRTLHDDFTSFQPDGSNATTRYVYRRISGSSGFAGAWESTTKPVGLKVELAIKRDGDNGLLIATGGSDKKIVFDGRDHPVSGTKDGSILSGRRTGARMMEYTEKSGGKIQRVHRFEASRDGRTFTEILSIAGQKTPDVLIFARE